MNFKLSAETKNLLQNRNYKPMSDKQRKYYDSRKFYSLHPDLAPRNIYLREKRVLKHDEVQEYLDKLSSKSIAEKCSGLMHKLKIFCHFA